jgi:hypothetical protein
LIRSQKKKEKNINNNNNKPHPPNQPTTPTRPREIYLHVWWWMTPPFLFIFSLLFKMY